MRLFFVNRYYWPDESATSLMLTDLAEGLAAAGHEVHVLASRQLLEDPRSDLPPGERHRGVQVHRLRTTRFGRAHLATRAIDYLSFYLSALGFLLWRLRRGDTVVAKTDPPLIGVVAAVACALRGASLVNWLQDCYPEVAFRLGALREKGWLAAALVRLRNWSLRKARANVAVGERMQAFITAEVAGCAPVWVIPNWARPLDTPDLPAAANEYRRQLGLQDQVVFCYSGNMGRAHEFQAILAAAALLRDQAHISFLVIGGGAQKAFVQSEVRSHGLGRWHFLPYQPRERLAESLGAADVHLVSLNPALEGLIVPSKIYGVLAAGRPCVFIGATDGEVARLLARNQCGLSTTGMEARELAGALERLAHSQAERRRLGVNARMAQHRPEQALEQWLSLLRA